tara:strand:- start:553 stop:1176 length:624 start_codon:yes stop_codon:yes gene_type:complete
MKTINIEHSELMSILIEAIIHSEKCSREGKICNTEKNWQLLDNKHAPDKIIISGKISKPLSEYVKAQKLDYNKAFRLTICLAEQLGALNEMGYGISHLDPNDILVLSEEWYLITNTDHIVPLENDNLKIMKPIVKSDFISPELANINKLPAIVDHRSSYYSMAVIVLFSIGLLNSLEDLVKIYPSSLYFLLERCLHKKPEKRMLLII